MSSRESEVVTYLRLDVTLAALVPGGTYSFGALPEPGITDAATTPGVWTGGVFQPCVIVRERLAVPQYRVMDEAAQLVDVAQVIEIYAYGKTQDAAHAALDRIYALTQGHRFTSAWAARFWGGMPIMRAPELPNVWQSRNDYMIDSLRVPA